MDFPTFVDQRQGCSLDISTGKLTLGWELLTSFRPQQRPLRTTLLPTRGLTARPFGEGSDMLDPGGIGIIDTGTSRGPVTVTIEPAMTRS